LQAVGPEYPGEDDPFGKLRVILSLSKDDLSVFNSQYHAVLDQSCTGWCMASVFSLTEYGFLEVCYDQYLDIEILGFGI